MARAAALKAVPNDPPEIRGDESLTEEAMAGWTPGQKRCRGRGRHNWGPFRVYMHGTWADVVEQCSHCRNRRQADHVKTAYGMRRVDKWKPDYREGYLLPKGAAPIDDNMKDGLVEADIMSRKITYVDDEGEE